MIGYAFVAILITAVMAEFWMAYLDWREKRYIATLLKRVVDRY